MKANKNINVTPVSPNFSANASKVFFFMIKKKSLKSFPKSAISFPIFFNMAIYQGYSSFLATSNKK